MEKAKSGVSVVLLGAAAYFLTYFGGYAAAILFAGYVLLCEEDEWLKKTCVQAIVLALGFDVLLRVIDLLPNLCAWIDSMLNVIGHTFNYSIISKLIAVFTKGINILEACVFLVLGGMAFKKINAFIPGMNKLVGK